ncbi:hypothetical protein ACIA8K_14760 [Catenuloplanes sp. NPDC051500]
MSMISRIQAKRETARRNRAIERALRSANTPALRDEILTIAQRHFG